jgi:hypothetical protein
MTQRIILPLSLLAVVLLAMIGLTARTHQIEPGTKPATGNVRDRGAKGDGATDDWQAIQDTVNSGGAVLLPPGTYRISKTVMIDLAKTGFTSIRGEGVARVVMAGTGPAFQFVGTHAGTADPKTFKDQVWEHERMPCVDAVEIVGDNAAADGIEASGTMQLTLTRLLIRKCRHGVHLTGRNRNVIVSDSHIYQNRGVGIFLDAVNLHQINVTGCHISYNDGGGVVCKAGEVRNLQVTGCDIESNQGVDSQPTANVFVDSTGGSNAEVAITGNTLQHNHQAPGSANVWIKGPSNPVKVTDELRDGHVIITGNVISDVKINVRLDHARGVIITGNTFWTAYEWNLLVEQSAFITVGPNNFDRNPRYAAEEKPETTNAIAFRDCTDCTLTGFTLSRTRASVAGVALERCQRFNVANLTLIECDEVGLLLRDVSNSRIAGCLIRDDRANAKSMSLSGFGGRGNMIVDNYLGRLANIPKGIGLVERNYGGEGNRGRE